MADVPGVTFGLHICKGNYESKWIATGGYEFTADKVFSRRRNFDVFLLEYDDERSGSFEPLANVPDDKFVVLGLVSSKLPEIEPADTALSAGSTRRPATSARSGSRCPPSAGSHRCPSAETSSARTPSSASSNWSRRWPTGSGSRRSARDQRRGQLAARPDTELTVAGADEAQDAQRAPERPGRAEPAGQLDLAGREAWRSPGSRQRNVARIRPPGALLLSLGLITVTAAAPSGEFLSIVVGYDGSPPASRALDAAVRLLRAGPAASRSCGWLHLSSTVMLSAGAIAEMEASFSELEPELRAQAAGQLNDSGLDWGFEWRQGLIADELIAVATGIRGPPRPDRGDRGRELVPRHAPRGRVGHR